MVGPLTYLVLRANAGSKSSLLQVVPKSKHANISNQRRFRLTDATIRSSPDWNKDNADVNSLLFTQKEAKSYAYGQDGLPSLPRQIWTRQPASFLGRGIRFILGAGQGYSQELKCPPHFSEQPRHFPMSRVHG